MQPIDPGADSNMAQPFPTSPIVAANTATDATTASGTITRAGRALGIITADIAADGKAIPWQFSGGASGNNTQTLDDDELENLGSLPQFSNGVAAGEVEPGAIGFTVDLSNLAAGEGEGVEIREADSQGRIVSGWGQGFHSDSSVLLDSDGAVVRADVELGTDRIFLTRAGVLEGEAGEGRPGADTEQQDRYHTSACLLKTTSGYVLFFTDHNERVYFVGSPTLQGLVDDNTPTAITDTGLDTTYIRLFADGDTIYTLHRGRIGSNSYVSVNIISDPYGTPSVDTRYLTKHGSLLHYPRGFFKLRGTGGSLDGALLVGIAVQMRESSGNWRGNSAVIWNPANHDVHGPGGTKVDTGSGADSNNEMVAEATFYTDGADNDCTVVAAKGGGSPTGQRYMSDRVHMELVQWDDSTKTAAILMTIADTDSTAVNDWQAADLRLLSLVGTTRIVTTAGTNPLGVSTSRSFRVPVSFIEAGGVLKCHVIDQPNGGELEGEPAVLYYHMGGERYQSWTVGDWKAATDGAELAAAFTSDNNVLDLPAPALNIKPVLNPDGTNSEHVYMDIAAPLGTLKNQTMRPGMIYSPTLDLQGDDAAADGGAVFMPTESGAAFL